MMVGMERSKSHRSIMLTRPRRSLGGQVNVQNAQTFLPFGDNSFEDVTRINDVAQNDVIVARNDDSNATLRTVMRPGHSAAISNRSPWKESSPLRRMMLAPVSFLKRNDSAFVQMAHDDLTLGVSFASGRIGDPPEIPAKDCPERGLLRVTRLERVP